MMETSSLLIKKTLYRKVHSLIENSFGVKLDVVTFVDVLFWYPVMAIFHWVLKVSFVFVFC